MKKIINDPNAFVDEALDGILAAHPTMLKAVSEDRRAIARVPTVLLQIRDDDDRASASAERLSRGIETDAVPGGAETGRDAVDGRQREGAIG